MSSINARVPPLRLMAVDTPADGEIPSYQSSSGDFEWVADAGSPTSAEYLLAYDASIPASLTAARKLTGGSSIGFSHGAGANDDMTINAVAAGSVYEIQYNSGVSNFFTSVAEFDYNPATGSLGVGTTTSNGPATVTIAADGTGKPVLNLTNASKSASLEVTTNNELTIKGGTESFSFDVSSATGGMTFPDGTELKSAEGTAILSTGETGATKFLREDGDGTSSWQAAGGGGGGLVDVLPLVGSTGADQYNIATSPPWGGTNNITEAIYALGRPYAFPFIAPATGTVSALGIEITTSDSTNVYVAIYSQDSNNLPSTRLGYATISLGSTGVVYQTSITGSIVLTAGEQFWYSLNTDAASFNAVLRAVNVFNCPSLGITDDLGDDAYSIKDTTSTQYAAPPSSFVTDEIDITTDRVIVGIKF